jgi:hypothetical protein
MSHSVAIITVVVIAAVLAFRIWRSTREQKWSVPGMWVLPSIFLLLTGVIVAIDVASSVWVVPASVAGLAAGVGIGLYQGTHTTVRVDAPVRSVFIKISPLGNLIFLTVLVLRIGLRFVLAPPTQAAAPQSFASLPPEAAIIGGALLALAAGMLFGLRIYVQRVYSAQLSA